MIASSDSEADNDRNVFLPEGTSKQKGFLSARLYKILLIVMATMVGALLIGVIVLARKRAQSGSESPTHTGSPTTPTPMTTWGPTTEPPQLWDQIRLPQTVLPVSYRIDIRVPDLADGHVTGDVTIRCNVVQSTDVIMLHADNMTITRSQIIDVTKSGSDVKINKPFLVKRTAYWVMPLAMPLSQNSVIDIELQWETNIGSGLKGFYRSQYTDSKGNIHHMGTTQMEATDARRAFPCFDEPEMKATFNISLLYDPAHSYNAISNMPIYLNETVQSQGAGPVLTRAHFLPTPRMSTYLVAFIVSDFQFVENRTASGTRIRVWARPEFLNQTRWALHCACVVLSYYESFFSIPYPLPKQDLVAIPDFSAGAMENWGLITYREVDLLFDPGTSATTNKQRVAVVIAHELAHQWFGNLVTMEWWNDLWLNEGFASYVEYIGTNAAAPQWNILDHFFVDTVLYAYSVDSLVTSHPIEVSVSTPDEIGSVFDSISYDKGASILQMLFSFLGKNTFLTGLHSYLTKHQYNNAQTRDLLSALDSVRGRDKLPSSVQSIMSTWTKQSGFPVVTCIEKPGQIILSQQRFIYSSANASLLPHSPYNYQWKIPITYFTDKVPQPASFWLTESHSTHSISGSFTWIKLNAQQTGYYRVNYTETMWRALANQLQADHTVFSATDRAGLIADSFDLARAGLLNITIGLELTKYLDKETDYIPWKAALAKFAYIRDMLSLTPSLGILQKFICDKLALLTSKYLNTKIPDSHDEKLLRAYVISSSWHYDCHVTDGTSAVNRISAHFEAFMAGNRTIDPDLHATVYGAGIAGGDVIEWEFVWNILHTTNVASEKRACLSALAQSTKPWILNRYLEYSLDETKIRPQDTDFVTIYVSRNVIGRSIAWNFLRRKWDELSARDKSASFSFRYFIRSVAASFNTQFQLDEYNDFFDGRDAGSGLRVVKETAEKIGSNIEWMKINEATVRSWFTTATKKP